MSIAPLAATADSRESHLPAGVESAGHSHGLFADILGLDLAATAQAQSAFDSGSTDWPELSPATGVHQLDLTLLGGLNISDIIGLQGITLPLITTPSGGPGLLDLGESLGALGAKSTSTSLIDTLAFAGVVDGAGNVQLDPNSDEIRNLENAKLNLNPLLTQLLGQTVADTLLDEASIQIGAVGSQAHAVNGEVDRTYMVADLQADVHSPLIGTLVGDVVQPTIAGLVAPIDTLFDTNGAVHTSLNGTINTLNALPLVSATLGDFGVDLTPIVTALNTQLIATPLKNQEETLEINLSNGLVTIDLAKLVIEDHPTATTLNDLDPNTEVLSAGVVNAILAGVTDALTGAGSNSLTSKVVQIVTDGIYNASVTIDLNVTVGVNAGLLGVHNVVEGPVTIDATIGGLVGATGHATPVIDVSGVALLPGLGSICVP
ncbi:MAG: choice-of-anchor G family protein, partial [Leucobacter sp.]|nr:choice-of-anchor G family protein [Leucobacter sp.]